MVHSEVMDVSKLQKHFLKNVVEILDERGWTRTVLAKRMGVDQPYISRYLNGKVCPGLDVIERFAKALGEDAVDLLRERVHEGA